MQCYQEHAGGSGVQVVGVEVKIKQQLQVINFPASLRGAKQETLGLPTYLGITNIDRDLGITNI